MKYIFYPERRFITFAPIMSNNPKSPIIDLQQQQLLLRMEYEYEKEEFKRQTETMGVARKVKARSLLVSCLSWPKLLQFAESACNRYYTDPKIKK